jgi:metal-dependent amidase/aminoacylase/carboxypeptidase family protein
MGAHDVRAVIAAHVQPLLPAGTIAATSGPVNAAVGNIEITVTGAGGHAAYPHATHDPVLALSEVVVSLQQAVSRRISPTSAAVLSIGMLRAGTAPGVLPAAARAWGTLRRSAQATWTPWRRLRRTSRNTSRWHMAARPSPRSIVVSRCW